MAIMMSIITRSMMLGILIIKIIRGYHLIRPRKVRLPKRW